MKHLGSSHTSSSTWIEDHVKEATAAALRAVYAFDLVGVTALEREFACVAIWRATRKLPAPPCAVRMRAYSMRATCRRTALLGASSARRQPTASLRSPRGRSV